MRVSVVLADDHRSVMDALRALVDAQPGLEVVGTADSLGQLPSLLAQRRPNVLMLDVRMGEENALDVLPELRAQHPQVKIIVLSMHAEEAYVFRALQLGADAYLLKQGPSAQLIDAIHAVIRGERYLGAGISVERLDQYEKHARSFSDDPLDLMTPREREVARLVARGLSSQAIADELGIGRRTVETHRANLLRKLGISTPIQLARKLLRKPT